MGVWKARKGKKRHGREGTVTECHCVRQCTQVVSSQQPLR